jgi:hypothetical protein
MLVRELPHDEEREAQRGEHRERHDRPGVEPVEILALVEHHLQRAHPDHEEPEAHRVDGSFFVSVSRVR